MPPHLALSHTAEEIVDACERARRLYGTAERALDEDALGVLRMQRECQGELAYAGVESVGGLWSENPLAEPPTAR